MPNLPITQAEYDGKPSYLKGKSRKWQSLYGRMWRAYRLRFIAKHPLCAECEKKGIIEPAAVVDHIEPHKGDILKFWNVKNHQALCKMCHDKKTAKEGAFGK